MAHKMKHSNKSPDDYWIGKGDIRKNIIEGDLFPNDNWKRKTADERLLLKLMKSKFGNVQKSH